MAIHRSFATGWLTIALAALLVAGFSLAPVPSEAARPGEGQSLSLAYGFWSADWLPTSVVQVLTEDYLGYDVEIVDLAIPAAYAMVAAGQVDAYANAWFPNQDYLLAQYGNQLEVVGWHYFDAIQGWAVPTWFAEEYDVWSVEDLDDPDIARLLDRNGDGRGDFMGCEIGWTCNDQHTHKLQAYGLDRLYTQIDASEQMINFEVQSALENREPVLFYLWTPDWLSAVYPTPDEVTLLLDPVGAWVDEGVEVDQHGWPAGYAGTLVNQDFKNRHPEAHALWSQISVPLDAVNESVYRQVVSGETSEADLEQHAREWIEANASVVDEWLEAAGIQ